MERITPRTVIYCLIDLALLVVCILHITSLQQRARAPFDAKDENQQVVVTTTLATEAAGLLPGDTLLTWHGQPVYSWAVIEHLANYSRIGEGVPVTYSRSGEHHSLSVGMIAAYDGQYILIVSLVGIITWALGVFVLLARPFDRTARVLHWCMVALGVAVVLAFEGVTPDSILGYVSSLLFFASYMSISAGFLLFTFMFPRMKTASFSLTALLITIPAAALTFLTAYNHYLAFTSVQATAFLKYMSWSAAFRLFVFLCLGGGLANFIHSYLTAGSRDERRKLQWILWGLCIGAIPFTLLTVAPQAIGMRELIPERFSLIFLLLIPASFTISVLKHHLLDIEVVINRTTTYGIVIGLLLAIYAGIVGMVAAWVGSQTVGVSALAAVFVALLFEPVRTRVQHFVDKKFFRVKYDFRLATREFAGKISQCYDIRQLADLMVQHTERLIPVERVGFFVLKQPGNRLCALAEKGFPLFAQRSVRFEPEKLKTRLQLPVAIDERIEPGVEHESADAEVFHRWGMALVFPMLSESNEVLGFLVLGEKKSGGRFMGEDVYLLSTVATQAGLEIERITLQQKLILKQAEADRFEELSRLKSDFVSYVSHELKSPLTSIKLYAGLIAHRASARDKRSREYVEAIKGEADRLNRMVTTILDSARIEHGEKEYTLKETDLREIVGEVMETMCYQLRTHGFRVHFTPSRRRLPIRADPDAVVQAVTNLIANSIKYSASRKYLKVSQGVTGEWAFCRIEDRGVGISPEALPHIFDKFYRDPSHKNRAEGVGLGLPLVRHIMDIHGGKVEVESTLGKGTVFTLCFPTLKVKREEQEKDPGR